MTSNAPQRIGLFGGTFDPVHTGHLRVAVELVEHYSLDRLHILPNHRPVHRDKPTASTEQRIGMLEAATEHLDNLYIDTREALRDKPSYTFDTLTEFRNEFPEATLVFFMGMDAFSGFDSWYRWQDILKLANLVVVNRPDATLSKWAAELIETQTKSVGGSISEARAGVIERRSVTQLAISATDIRARVAAGQSIDYLVPASVKRYIVQHALYKT